MQHNYACDSAKIKPFSLKLNKNGKKRNFLIQNVFTPKKNLQNYDFLVESKLVQIFYDFYHLSPFSHIFFTFRPLNAL